MLYWFAFKIVLFIKFWLVIFLRCFGIVCSESSAVLCHGFHEIEIDLYPKKPQYIWVRFCHHQGVPVCQGDVDRIGIVRKDNSFVICANINSEIRQIHWFVISL